MPPAPELRHRGRDIRIVKILRKTEAQHLPQPYCHIGIAGKIKINLEGKRQNSHPGGQRAHLPQAHFRNRHPKFTHIVGNQHLFRQAEAEALHPAADRLQAGFPVVKAGLHIPVLHDGTGYQLRKHGNIHAEIQQVLLHLCFSPIHVNGIRHGLKGIEGNPYGQRKRQKRKRSSCRGIDRLYQKIRVFEKAQYRQINQHRREQNRLCSPLPAEAPQQPPVEIIGHGGKKHQQYVYRLPPGIKKQAPQKENNILASPGNQIVQYEKQGQKTE